MLESWPFWAAFGFLFLGAVVRGSVTYAIGRGARGAAERRLAKGESRHERGALLAQGERLVRRVGPPAVSLGFLTVGLQTAINLSAGALRMPWTHFGPALVVGATLWATVYTTIGFAVLEAALGGLPWWWALVALGVVAAIVLLSRRLSRDT